MVSRTSLEDLRFVDVDHRRAEVIVAGRVHDLERLVAADRSPGDGYLRG
jgi:hypothetical protein